MVGRDGDLLLSHRIASFKAFPKTCSTLKLLDLANRGYLFDSGNLRCMECGWEMSCSHPCIVEHHHDSFPQCGVAIKHLSNVLPEGATVEMDCAIPGADGPTDTDGDPITASDEMRYEWRRLLSFKGSNNRHAKSFAENGFFLSNGSIRCYACSFCMSLHPWQMVMHEHSKLSPGCPFARGHAHNVPYTVPCPPPPDGRRLPNKGGTHDRNFLDRLATFGCWDPLKNLGISTIALAQAGFSYSGEGDRVHCDTCGLIMIKLVGGVDMFVEHATNSPCCSFVDLIKSKSYYKNAIEIKNIALTKAQKPELNIQLVDVKNSIRAEYGADYPDWILDYACGSHANFVKDLGYPPKIVHQAIFENFRKTETCFETSLGLLETVQKLHEEKRPFLGDNNFGSPDSWRVGLCPQCQENPVTHAFAGCRHLCVCHSCATLLNSCPVCGMHNRAVMRLFLAQDSE